MAAAVSLVIVTPPVYQFFSLAPVFSSSAFAPAIAPYSRSRGVVVLSSWGSG
uniref:Uncharacterized protein n=1 Tax=Arundo donax TaxID=35708 RepID=A0A0A9EXR5_ARUDO